MTTLPAGDLTAHFSAPTGMAGDLNGFPQGDNYFEFPYLIVADTLNNTIRRVDPLTGAVTLVAGTPGVEGSIGNLFRGPTAVAILQDGSAADRFHKDMLVADTGNHTIRRIHFIYDANSEIYTPQVSNVAGSPGQAGYSDQGAGLFNAPQGLLIFSGWVYVADTGNSVIRRISLSNGQVETVAGIAGQPGHTDSTAGTPTFDHPTALAAVESTLYVADTGNATIRSIALNLAGTPVRTLAGSPGQAGYQPQPSVGNNYATGSGNTALFAEPAGLSASTFAGTWLRVTDRGSHVVWEIDLDPSQPQPVVRKLAGTAWQPGLDDGDDATARFGTLTGIVSVRIGMEDQVFVVDRSNNSLRAISRQTPAASVSTLVGTPTSGSGDGWPADLDIGHPDTMICDGNRLIINGRGVQIVDLSPDATEGTVRVLTSVPPEIATPAPPGGAFARAGGNLYYAHQHSVERIDLGTGVLHRLTLATGEDVLYDFVASIGDRVYVTGRYDNGSLPNFLNEMSYDPDVDALVETSPLVSIAAPPIGPTVTDGSSLYIGVVGGIVAVNPRLGGASTSFSIADTQNGINGIAIGNGYAYYTVTGRHYIRRFNLTSHNTSIVAGSANGAAPFFNPKGLCVIGNNLFETDTNQGKAVIRKIDLATHTITTLALSRPQP